MDVEITEKTIKNKKKMIALEIPESLYEDLLKECKRTCLGVSAVVRLAVLTYLDKDKSC